MMTKRISGGNLHTMRGEQKTGNFRPETYQDQKTIIESKHGNKTFYYTLELGDLEE